MKYLSPRHSAVGWRVTVRELSLRRLQANRSHLEMKREGNKSQKQRLPDSKGCLRLSALSVTADRAGSCCLVHLLAWLGTSRDPRSEIHISKAADIAVQEQQAHFYHPQQRLSGKSAMSAWQGRASASERVPRADGWASPAGKVSLAASHLASRGHALHS